MASDTLTDTVEHSAAPAAVAVAIERLVEAHDGLATRLDADGGLRDAIVAVTAASRALTDACLRDGRAIDVLADLERRPALDADDAAALASWKRLGWLGRPGFDALDNVDEQVRAEFSRRSGIPEPSRDASPLERAAWMWGFLNRELL